MTRPASLLPLLLLAGCTAAAAGAPPIPTVTVRPTSPGTPTSVASIETGAGRVSDTQYTVAADPAKLWPSVLAVYTELGLTPSTVDEKQLLVAVRGQRAMRKLAGDLLSSFLECGQGPSGKLADLYRVQMDVGTRLVQRAAGYTTVETSVAAMASNPAGSMSNPVACGSTGTLENRIAGMLRLRAAALPR
jgi:hypothetical protein